MRRILLLFIAASLVEAFFLARPTEEERLKQAVARFEATHKPFVYDALMGGDGRR